MKFYMIRKTGTNLYSSGGSSPQFKTVGKIWNKIGSLKSHLRLVSSHYRAFYDNCELVVFEEFPQSPGDITLEEIARPILEDAIVKKLKGTHT